jgi:transposase
VLSLPPSVHIHLCVEPADMRRSFDGLALLVQQFLGADPLSGHLFVFRNKPGDRLKLLFWDGDGYVIYYKKQIQECPHSFVFTEFGELAHNLPVRLG